MEPQSVRVEPRSDQPLQPGTVLGGRYEIVEASDEAAFGTLYRARSRTDGTPVTVEILDARLFGDARLRQGVRQELEAIAGLSHKNLATPLHFADEMLPGGTLSYIVLEQLDGQSLADMNAKKRAGGKAFSLKGAYNVVAHLANALSALHGFAWHGGLSPRSIHVSSQGRVKVLELGLARALLAGAARGTVARVVPTLAPETASAPDQVGVRADVYATGAVLYELLTGVPPASPPVPASSLAPGLPPAIDEVLDRCLRARIDERYPDMARLKEALQAAVGPEIAPAVAAPQTATATATAATSAAPVLSSAPAPPPAAVRPPPRPPSPPAQRAPAPAAPAPSRGGPSAPAGVPKSFSVDAALSSADESTERWLIQKDKLDFGPFNLRDVRAQIEAGKILGEHTIVDTETGERRRVKDHPQLRELVVQSEAANAENERLRLEAQERSKHRGRVVSLLGIIAVIVIAGGGATFWYLQHMKAKVVVVKEQVEPELKFEIAMKVDPPEKKAGGKKVRRTAGGKNVYDDTTVLGDASEGGGGEETLDGPTVQRVMNQNFKMLVGCVYEERHRNPSLHTIDMDFIIKGSGQVQAVKVNGTTAGPFAACIYGKMQTFSFPKFNGSKTHASFSLNIK